ncbi:peptidoglycan-binding domain-containing protein [Streptomyces misionensis]|uniref:peptidoglycan-binding domain-containing protein n=1 Tax=Streptomyces misionensis TaxID=67331 RepID=UPI00396C0B68
MRIVYADGTSERELELRVGRPDATLADLAGPLGLPAGGLIVDGRTAPPETVLNESGLVHGPRVGLAGWDAAGPRGPAAVLRLVGGLEATVLTQYGDRLSRVSEVQCILQRRGYDIGPCGADGQFGPDTSSAVKHLQQRHGLQVDGQVGANTWPALRG